MLVEENMPGLIDKYASLKHLLARIVIQMMIARILVFAGLPTLKLP